jgi:hypothetical protein
VGLQFNIPQETGRHELRSLTWGCETSNNRCGCAHRSLTPMREASIDVSHSIRIGDHWLGEKELFHDTIVKVPMIVVDPRADATPRAARRSTRLWKPLTWCQPSLTR